MLEISKSGYYDWLRGASHQPAPAKAYRQQQIVDTFVEHRSRYGARRIAAALQQQGVPGGREQAGRVLGERGLKAIQPRSFVPRTTDSRHSYPISANLLLERPAPQKLG